MEQTAAQISERIKEIYVEACHRRLCSSKQTFAALAGVTRQTMSSAMNGSELYCTDKLLAKCEAILRQPVSITMENSGEAHDNTQNNFGGDHEAAIEGLRDIVTKFTDSLREERESHERIMIALIEKIGEK